MVMCCNSNVKRVYYLLLVCHAFILPHLVESLIDFLNPLPNVTNIVFEGEISFNQPLKSTILSVKARDRDAGPSVMYGETFAYVLINETTEDQATSATPTDIITTEWLKSHISAAYKSVRERRYLAVDGQTGMVYLKKPLDIDAIGRITARVLIVDFRQPMTKEIVTVVINVIVISQPSNVSVDSVSDVSARACWSSTDETDDGYIVEFQAIADGSHNIRNVPVTNGSAGDIMCACVEVIPGSDYELWVYGHKDGIAGSPSDKIFFTTHLTRKIVCEKGFHEPRIYYRAPAGTHVTYVKAYDAINSQPISYRLATGSDTFGINETSGQLTTSVTITKAINDTYNVSVMAMSGAAIELCNVEISVTHKNRAWPQFTRRAYRSDIVYNTSVGSTIETVKANKDDPMDIYYLIKEIKINEHSGPIHDLDLPNLGSSETWLADDLVDLYNETTMGINRYLDIDRSSGAIYLKQSLDINVHRIIASVLAVDGGSPAHYDTAYVIIYLLAIGPPLNVTVTNITEVHARVCWYKPSYGNIKGFVVQVETSKDSPVRNHTVQLGRLSSEEPFCTFIGLEKAIQHRLLVHGYDDKVVGLNSGQVIINIMNQPTTIDSQCLEN